MAPYHSPFQLVAEELAAKEVPCVLIGGYAVLAHNFSRLTTDIDFLICDGDRAKAKKALEKEVYHASQSSELFTRFKSSNPGMPVIDLLYVDKATFEEIRMKGREIKVENKSFVIPNLFHLLALKMHALKNNPKRREAKDLLDVVGLVKENHIDTRSKDFRSLCDRYGTPAIYNRVAAFFGDHGQ